MHYWAAVPTLRAGWYLDTAQERKQITSGGSKFTTHALLEPIWLCAVKGQVVFVSQWDFENKTYFRLLLDMWWCQRCTEASTRRRLQFYKAEFGPG